MFAGLIVVTLQTFLNRTVTGRAMQAVAQNRTPPRCSASTSGAWFSTRS